MTLLQKGILLIAIPLLGQFIFVLVLVGAYRASEEMAWKDTHYRTQTQELMSMSVYLYKAIAQLSAYGLTQQASALVAFDRQHEELVRKMELLTLLNREQPTKSSKEALGALEKSVAGLYQARQIAELKGSMGGPSSVELVEDLRADVWASLNSLEALIAERAATGAVNVNELVRARNLFLAAIVGGFALNAGVSAWILFVYANRFANRFGIIVDNTKRVATGNALNPPLDGTDELRALDKVFHEMNAALKEAEARKEQFLQMVSHDMRSPLTSVQLTLELASSNFFGEVAPMAVARLQESEKLVKRLTRLINDILDFDKIRAGKFDLTLNVVDVPKLLESCAIELEPIASRSNVSLKVLCSAEKVVADQERLTQVVINLVANSIKFSPREDSIELSAIPDGDFVRFSVRDHGPGIPADFQEKIFLPFEQVPDSSKNKVGTGLGLAICKMLIEMQGGKIGVEVPQSGGSIFWFTLPIAITDEL